MTLKVFFTATFVLLSFEKLLCHASMLNPYFEDISIDFVNYSYFDTNTFDISINYKPKSMNSLNIRFEIIKDVPENPMIQLEVSSRIFNQEVPTGLAFHSSLCDNGNAKYFYEMLAVPLNIKDCPPEKGLYEIEDFVPDLSKVPVPLVPGTSLLVSTHIYSGDIQLLDYKTFIVV